MRLRHRLETVRVALVLERRREIREAARIRHVPVRHMHVRARVRVVGWVSSRWDRRQVPVASTAPYRYRRGWQFLPPMTLEYPNSASEYPQHPCSADLARRSLSAGPSMSHTSIRWPCTNVATSHVAFRIQLFRHVEPLQHRELLTVQRNWRPTTVVRLW